MAWRRGHRLRLVAEAEAQGRTLEIYQEIKQALGVPLVNVLFQAYGAYPQFLELHWQAVRPALQCQAFFALGDRLRAEAYTRMHNYFHVPDLCKRMENLGFSTGAKGDVERITDIFYHVNPLLLLVASAQAQAFDGRVGQACSHHEPAQPPRFEERPVLVPEEGAEPEVRRIFDEIRRGVGAPFVNSDYRAFARWPDFLHVYWEVLKAMLQSPLYAQSQEGVRETAWALAREFPHPIELTSSQLLDAGMDDDDVADVVRITDMFAKLLSGLLLNLAMAKIGLEGGNQNAERAA